jgi:hypothetical protein
MFGSTTLRVDEFSQHRFFRRTFCDHFHRHVRLDESGICRQLYKMLLSYIDNQCWYAIKFFIHSLQRRCKKIKQIFPINLETTQCDTCMQIRVGNSVFDNKMAKVLVFSYVYIHFSAVCELVRHKT